MWNAGINGTDIPYQDLIGASATGGITPNTLIPSINHSYTPGDLDNLGLSSIDGGPGTHAHEEDGIIQIDSPIILNIKILDIRRGMIIGTN